MSAMCYLPCIHEEDGHHDTEDPAGGSLNSVSGCNDSSSSDEDDTIPAKYRRREGLRSSISRVFIPAHTSENSDERRSLRVDKTIGKVHGSGLLPLSRKEQMMQYQGQVVVMPLYTASDNPRKCRTFAHCCINGTHLTLTLFVGAEPKLDKSIVKIPLDHLIVKPHATNATAMSLRANTNETSMACIDTRVFLEVPSESARNSWLTVFQACGVPIEPDFETLAIDSRGTTTTSSTTTDSTNQSGSTTVGPRTLGRFASAPLYCGADADREHMTASQLLSRWLPCRRLDITSLCTIATVCACVLRL